MSAGRRHLQRALRRLLAPHLGQVELLRGRCLEEGFHVDSHRVDRRVALEPQRGLAKVAHGDDVEPLHHGRLGGVLGGHDHGVEPHGMGAHGDGQGALDRADRPGQRELAHHHDAVETARFRLLRGGEDAQRNGKVEGRPLLPDVRRGEVYHHPSQRGMEGGVGQRAHHAVRGFLHRRVWQAHDRHPRVSISGINLDLDGDGIDADDGGGLGLGKHGGGGRGRRWRVQGPGCVPDSRASRS